MKIYHFNMDGLQEQDYCYFLMGFRKENVDEVVKQAIEKGYYKEVAHVNTNDLEEAFHLTNHINKNWETNKDVTAYETNNRSSSVGDIFVLENEGFLVSSIGFKKLPDEMSNKLVEKSSNISSVSKAIKLK